MSAALATWDAVELVDGYNVYLKKNGIYGKSNTSLISATQFKMTNLSPGTYSAYCTAVKSETESDPSNIASFTIALGSLYNPKNLSSLVAGSDVTLSWDYVPGITTYNVYLSTGGAFTKQNTNLITSNSFEITGLSTDTYTWYVSSVYDGSEVDSDEDTFNVGAS